MKKLLLALTMAAGLSGSVWAAESVWRYVDASGQVTYSNVPVKGQKGERVEILAHPAPAPARAGGGQAAAPIPAEVLRQLQGGAVRPAALPAGLPPLPALPGAAPGVSAAPAPAVAAEGPEPRWAKEVRGDSAPQPAWARDPFTQR